MKQKKAIGINFWGDNLIQEFTNMFDNSEVKVLLPPKNAFKCSIVCKFIEILDLPPIGTQKSRKNVHLLKSILPSRIFYASPSAK